MPRMILNVDALAHNSRMTARYSADWGVTLLPVLKGIASHPEAVKVLRANGFYRFGFAEPDEPALFGAADLRPDQRVLIQLTPLSRVREVAEVYGRTFQAAPEIMAALDEAVGGGGLPPREIVIMVDLGDVREGVGEAEVGPVLDFALGLKNLKVAGLGTTMACLSDCLPPLSNLAGRLNKLKELFEAKGVAEPVVSVGGSFFCGWLAENPAGSITELRLGDPFILGEDIYRQAALPGGPFRQDVCEFVAEVVEIRDREIGPESESECLHHLDGQARVLPGPVGRRRRALLDAGRFHISLGGILSSEPLILGRFKCHLQGAVITGITAGYLVLDITDCRQRVQVGQHISFHPGYWAMARAFRNPTTLISVKQDEPKPAGLPSN